MCVIAEFGRHCERNFLWGMTITEYSLIHFKRLSRPVVHGAKLLRTCFSYTPKPFNLIDRAMTIGTFSVSTVDAKKRVVVAIHLSFLASTLAELITRSQCSVARMIADSIDCAQSGMIYFDMFPCV